MAIQKFPASELLNLPLRDWGHGKASGSSPPSRITGKKISVAGCTAGSYGIWEASQGTFVREVETGEYMHILSGECTFTGDDGIEVPIRSGDTLFFPPGTKGVWRVTTPVRKVYVML